MSEPVVRVLTFSDISRCPKMSLVPAHYHDDGTCRCAERSAAHRAVAAARLAVIAAKEQLAEAEAWKRST